MSKPQVKQSIKDVLPSLAEPYPPQLVKFTESLYSLSMQKQPVLANRAEIARFHICAYLSAEKYKDSLNLPDPEISKIPVQPKVVGKIIDDFRVNLLNGVRSPTTSPASSPRKRGQSPFTTPTKRSRPNPELVNIATTPKLSSPLKRLQAVRDESPKTPLSALHDVESPFNPKTKSPTKSAPSTPSTPRYQKQISISDLTMFANNFYIPSTVTPRLVESFLDQRHKFIKKSEWLLACGLIHAAYIRVNHQILDSKMGAKTQFQDQLFHYQKGGLMKWNMILWINIIEDSTKNEPWIVELERKFVDGTWNAKGDPRPREIEVKLGKEWEVLEKFGSMITANVMFDTKSQDEYYKTWSKRLLDELDKETESN